LPIPDKGIHLSLAYRHQCKPDEYHHPYQLGHIYGGLGQQSMEYPLRPVAEVYLLKTKAIKRPEEGSGFKPHLVKDEMGEGAEGKDEEPEFPVTSVEIETDKGNNDKKEEGVAKYPAIAEGVSKEELPHGLINDVRKK